MKTNSTNKTLTSPEHGELIHDKDWEIRLSNNRSWMLIFYEGKLLKATNLVVEAEMLEELKQKILEAGKDN